MELTFIITLVGGIVSLIIILFALHLLVKIINGIEGCRVLLHGIYKRLDSSPQAPAEVAGEQSDQ